MIKAYSFVLILAAAPAFAQSSPAVGPPLAQQAEQSRLSAVARARAQAAAKARFQADLTIPSPTGSADLGRARPAADQPEAAAGRAAPSPYGGYYRIHTPWDPQ